MITGGIINEWGSNARLGNGKWMIVEADESDGTFIKIPTQIGVVTNIDPEHLDYFKTGREHAPRVRDLLRNIPFYGLAVACIDHPVVREMIERLELRARRAPAADLRRRAGADLVLKSARVEGARPSSMPISARACGRGAHARGWSVPLPGHHNALNALAAIAVASEAGIGDDKIARRWPASPASSGASSSPAPGTASPSTTTTATTPWRSRPCWRPRGAVRGPCHRRRRAASLHARARPLRRVRRLLQGRRQRHRHAALFGGRRSDRRHRPPPLAEASGRPDTDRWRPSTRAGDLVRRQAAGAAGRHGRLSRRRQQHRMGARAARLAGRGAERAGSAA